MFTKINFTSHNIKFCRKVFINQRNNQQNKKKTIQCAYTTLPKRINIKSFSRNKTEIWDQVKKNK